MQNFKSFQKKQPKHEGMGLVDICQKYKLQYFQRAGIMNCKESKLQSKLQEKMRCKWRHESKQIKGKWCKVNDVLMNFDRESIIIHSMWFVKTNL